MHHPHYKDRGATLVEYAMVVALVVVVLIGAITRITDSGDEQLEASGDRVGTPADNSYYAGTSSTSSTTPSSSTTTTSLPGQPVQPSSITKAPNPSNTGSKWVANATVMVTRTASPFAGTAGLLVTGNWSDGTGQPEVQTCTTTASGSCSVQFTDITDSKPTVTFTITSITGPGFFWTAGGPGDVTSLAVSCSPPLNASCD